MATGAFPLPVAKPDGKPFPCQQHACGCVTSEQCWADCCCFTPREKLAWARENHVEPPAELIAQVEHLDDRDHPEHTATAQGGHKHCCSSAAHCATATDDHEHATACAHDKADDDLVAESGPAPSLELTVVIGALARRCRGLPTAWIMVDISLPPAILLPTDLLAERSEWLRPMQPLCIYAESSPPVPPPRLV